MKKTIAILLVLVIGMAGVFAAENIEASLALTTSVTSYNLLAITDSTTTTFDFDEDPESLSTSFDVANAFVAPVTAAHLHYKTNNAGPVTLKISGSALVNDGDGAFMPYTLTCGSATIVTVNATEVISTNDVFAYAQTGLETASLPIEVQITEGDDLDDYTAGTYSTTVKFNFSAT
jgi:hypothetical protein